MPALQAIEVGTVNKPAVGKSITNSPCPGIKAGNDKATIIANIILNVSLGSDVFDKNETTNMPIRHVMNKV